MVIMSAATPVVSVIIPAYRSEQVLARALGSLLAQGFRDWEAVIVEDGGPEASWEIIRAYSWLDPRIRAIRQPHGGVCAARNTGIADARGQYLLFLDADDWLEPDVLAVMVQACERDRWAAAHGRLRYVTSDGAPTSWTGGCPQDESLFEALSSSNVLSVPSCVLLRRKLVNEIGGFDAGLVHCGDWDFWARLARHADSVGGIGELVTNYRMSAGSLSRKPMTLLRDADTVLRRIHAPDPRVKRQTPRLARGAEPMHLNSRIANFSVYAAGLAAASGRYASVSDILDTVPHWPSLSPRRTAEFIFSALCFAHCRGPEDFQIFWPGCRHSVGKLLTDLEQRNGTPDLAEQTRSELENLADAHDLWSSPALPAEHLHTSDLVLPPLIPASETYVDAMLRALAAGGAV
jgi:glycosyltransferase involved in cell wall biosynthesis